MLKLVRISSIVIATGALAFFSSAIAVQPASSGDVVVSASRNANLEENQRSLHFRDLALNGQLGQRALIRRVAFAIDSLCAGSDASISQVNALKYNATVWNSAEPSDRTAGSSMSINTCAVSPWRLALATKRDAGE